MDAPSHRRFLLVRDRDISGVSGTGVVAEGVHWPHGDVVALRWTSEWPTSVVFHDRGLTSTTEVVEAHTVGTDPVLPGFLAFHRRIPAGERQVVGLFRADDVITVTGVPAHERLVVPDFVPDDVPF